jgi:hypothetical protein
MSVGTGDSTQLARLSGVPRTSVYPVLDELVAKRLVERLPGGDPATWGSVGRAEVLARLEAAEEQRLAQYRERTARLGEMLAEAMPDAPEAPLPCVHLLPKPDQARQAYEEILTGARHELLMFTRPPYAWKLGQPNPVVLATLARGVKARVLYQAAEWADPDAEGFGTEMSAYHRAGVQARLVEDLPIKLVVVDRRTTLVSMSDPHSDAGYPTIMSIDHPGYAAVQADAFEQRWATGAPVPHSDGDEGPEPAAPAGGPDGVTVMSSRRPTARKRRGISSTNTGASGKTRPRSS